MIHYIGSFVLIFISICWGGYVASVLWEWFASPLGVPNITYLQAIGIACLINVFLGTRGIQIKEGETDFEWFKEALAWGIANPLIMLVIGWLVK